MAQQPQAEGASKITPPEAGKKVPAARMSPLAQQAARSDSLKKMTGYGGSSPAEQMAPVKRSGNPIKALFTALRGKR